MHEEVLVVDRGKREPVHLVRTQQVVHIGTRVVRARVALAALLERTEIVLVLRALDVVTAVAREDRAVTPATRRRHAIEGVAAVLHAGEDVVHRGDAEHVPGPAFGHLVADPRADVADDPLLHRAAYADAVEVERGNLRGRMPA